MLLNLFWIYWLIEWLIDWINDWVIDILSPIEEFVIFFSSFIHGDLIKFLRRIDFVVNYYLHSIFYYLCIKSFFLELLTWYDYSRERVYFSNNLSDQIERKKNKVIKYCLQTWEEGSNCLVDRLRCFYVLIYFYFHEIQCHSYHWKESTSYFYLFQKNRKKNIFREDLSFHFLINFLYE